MTLIGSHVEDILTSSDIDSKTINHLSHCHTCGKPGVPLALFPIIGFRVCYCLSRAGTALHVSALPEQVLSELGVTDDAFLVEVRDTATSKAQANGSGVMLCPTCCSSHTHQQLLQDSYRTR